MTTTTNTTTREHPALFLGGVWTTPHSAERITVRSANTGDIVGSVPSADDVDIDAAVASARAAYDDPRGWAAWDVQARAAVMGRFADALVARADEMAELISLQNGMPIFLSRMTDSRFASHLLRYYAGLATATDTDEIRASSSGGRTLVRTVPVGVVAAIVPWNFPNIMAALKYAPALAAGCTRSTSDINRPEHTHHERNSPSSFSTGLCTSSQMVRHTRRQPGRRSSSRSGPSTVSSSHPDRRTS